MKAFSLIEILVAVAIVGIVIGFGYPALLSAREDAELRTAEANAGLFNRFATEMRMEYLSGPGTVGNNKEAAFAEYMGRGYLQRPISIERLEFLDGQWLIVL